MTFTFLMMKKISIILLLCDIGNVFGNIEITDDSELRRTRAIVDIVKSNLRTNGWNNILCVGPLPTEFHNGIKDIGLTFVTWNVNNEENEIENAVPYHSNVIIISCTDFQDFENNLLSLVYNPHWHPLANIIVYYHNSSDIAEIAKILYIIWHHKGANAILIIYDDENEVLEVFHYSPYVDENSSFTIRYGCWLSVKSGVTIRSDFTNNFNCVEGCGNITMNSKLRKYYYGTCVGVDSYKVSYKNTKNLTSIDLFPDKTANLNGFKLRAYVYETIPFMVFEESNGTLILHNRDGHLWNTMAKLMNFKMDYSSMMEMDKYKKPFKFDVNIQYVFDFTKGYADLLLVPVYQFDVVVIDVDFTVPFTDSGVCIVSHRADYQTVLFDEKLITNNFEMIVRAVSCFVLLWLTFFIHNAMENNRFNLDQLGRDLLNAFRSILSISLYRPPKKRSFRIVIAVSTWGYFVINFATQAAIISFFSAYKRGKEVDTFEDVIQKGYYLEGMSSPDVLLPNVEERFNKINDKIRPVDDMFMCMNKMRNNSRRFCLNDCAVARYYARNKLDDKGEQYLHIATQDRMHSHYLNMFLRKHSAMTDNYNKYMQRIIEGGLVKKWEEYRFTDIKETTPIKSLTMTDLASIFQAFGCLLLVCTVIFLIELLVGSINNIRRFIKKWKKIRAVRKKLGLERKLGKIKLSNSSTQTI